MGWLIVIGIIVVPLALWGVIAPRSQWEVLQSWRFRDADANEPSDAAYLLTRITSVIVIAGLVIAGVNLAALANDGGRPEPTVSASADVPAAWGSGAVELFDRIVPLDTGVRTDLAQQQLTGYATVDGDGSPAYLWNLQEYEALAGLSDRLLGRPPGAIASALDTADLVVGIRNGILCTPRSVIVTESDTEVRIGVFTGSLTDPAKPDAAACAHPKESDPVVLIPIDLPTALGSRALTDLSGAPITHVASP